MKRDTRTLDMDFHAMGVLAPLPAQMSLAAALCSPDAVTMLQTTLYTDDPQKPPHALQERRR